MAAKVLSSGIRYSDLPESYVRPESDRPRLSEVSECENVPVIDLGCPDRSHIVQQISLACTHYGFFQVINHGVSKEAVERMLEAAHGFFGLPVEEKLKLYSDDPSKTTRLSTSFNVKKETVHNWRDYLRLHCYPLHKYVPEWPSNPPSFKEIVSRYCVEVRGLGYRLQELISESLGLEKDYITNVLGEQGQHMAALSNGRYKSVWHRAIVNADKPRMSVASFLCPYDHALISPAKPLTEDECGAVYRGFTYAEYYSKFWSRNLDQEHCLELFKN
ncbi:hypothetical protein V6N13_073799 [Hibiscus sabdariffa]|uniref:Uncharacterized protein n=1 Tax=Hibiscus sabdariffa TaxID=183260 RepID=A0ABR2BZM3_9ROSI